MPLLVQPVAVFPQFHLLKAFIIYLIFFSVQGDGGALPYGVSEGGGCSTVLGCVEKHFISLPKLWFLISKLKFSVYAACSQLSSDRFSVVLNGLKSELSKMWVLVRSELYPQRARPRPRPLPLCQAHSRVLTPHLLESTGSFTHPSTPSCPFPHLVEAFVCILACRPAASTESSRLPLPHSLHLGWMTSAADRVLGLRGPWGLSQGRP